MAQQIINVGTDANYGDGEPLRTAFIKVNENFTEVYAEILEGRDSNVVGSDSTILVDAENNKINLDGTVKGDIIPDTNVAYDIGSATKRFKDLYLSGNTINLGGTAISVESGELKLGGVKIPSQTDLDTSIADVTAGKFSFNITGDDSTVRTVQSGSNISIKGGANITTASDVDGNITITGPDLSSYLTTETSHADVVVDGDFTSSGFMKTDGAGNYSVDSATYLSAVSLGQVTGVDINNPQDNQVLSYNASSGDWVNANPSGGSEAKTYSIANGDWTSNIYMEGINNRITLIHSTPFSPSGNVVGTWYYYLYNLKAGDQITVHFNNNNSPGGGPIDITQTLTVTSTSYTGYTSLLIDVTGHSFTDNYNIDSITFEHPDGHVALGQDNFPRLGGDLYTMGYAIRTPQHGMDLVLDPDGPGNVNVSTSKIINVVDPTDPQDAATKAYVDANAGGGGGEFATIGTGNLYSANLTNFANTYTSGTNNFFAGTSAGNSTTSGYNNVAIGESALQSNLTGYRNVAIGDFALSAATQRSENIGIGRYANGANTAGTQNIAMGTAALFSNTGDRNVAIGHSVQGTGAPGGGNDQVLVGYQAGYMSQGPTHFNTFVGSNSGHHNGNGMSNNTYVGYSAGYYFSGASETTIIGSNAGGNSFLSQATGSNNTVIGYQAAISAFNVSDEITLGNNSITTLRCNTQSITSLSDARDKKDVEDLSLGLNLVERLRPVAFTWNMRDGGKVDQPDTGFIAQELQQAQEDEGVVLPGLVYATNPEKLEASYGKLIPSLVKSIQELSAQVKELQQQIKDIKGD